MDWDGLCVFLQEIRVFLEKSRNDGQDVIVQSLIEKCEFFQSTSAINLNFKDEVDQGKGGTYLNMTKTATQQEEPLSDYIDMDDYGATDTDTYALPTHLTPTECPYMGLPFAHLKLNKNVLIIHENTKISGKKSTVTCVLLKGSWLLYYPSNKVNALKPNKYFLIDHLDVPTPGEQALQLTVYCLQDAPQTIHFESGTIREMWIRAIREQLPTLEDGVYDDPNNLRMDEHLYKTIKFDYDIPKMPPKPVDGQQAKEQQVKSDTKVIPNRAEFQLKYQEIKEQLASQLRQQKSGLPPAERSQRSNSVVSPPKKFGRFISLFRSSSTTANGTVSISSPIQEISPPQKKSSPDKTGKIMKHQRNTTVFSSDYEIVGA